MPFCRVRGKPDEAVKPRFSGRNKVLRPACFPAGLGPNRRGEVGGGRATRQPGQVRKEAALTRSGSGRSSVSYLFSERIAGRAHDPRLPFAPFRKSRAKDIKLRIDQ